MDGIKIISFLSRVLNRAIHKPKAVHGKKCTAKKQTPDGVTNLLGGGEHHATGVDGLISDGCNMVSEKLHEERKVGERKAWPYNNRMGVQMVVRHKHIRKLHGGDRREGQAFAEDLQTRTFRVLLFRTILLAVSNKNATSAWLNPAKIYSNLLFRESCVFFLLGMESSIAIDHTHIVTGVLSFDKGTHKLPILVLCFEGELSSILGLAQGAILIFVRRILYQIIKLVAKRFFLK